MRRPLVSILVPVYNVEKELERCLDSLCRQTMSNIEIVCVNDGSTDDSLKILEKYRKKDPRIVIVNKENGGLPSARNAGIERAKGKYIGFVDSDDYVETTMFQKMYETAEQEQSEVVICGGHIFPEEPRANGWYYATLSPSYQHYDKYEPALVFENIYTTPFLWRVFVSRNLIERNHLRLEETVSLGEDKAFQTKLYREAKGITVIPDKLYHYCWIREGSIMNSENFSNTSKKVRGHVKLVKHIAEIIKEDDEKQKLAYLRWSIPFIYADYISLSLVDKQELAAGLIEVWDGSGYKALSHMLEPWIKEQYQYVEDVVRKNVFDKVKLSVILVADENAEYIENAFKSLNRQTLRELEIVVINSGSSDKIYSIIHKNLFINKQIRLLNMERKQYSEAVEAGIEMASGEYITICGSDGWYLKDTTLEQWCSYAEKEHCDMCAGATKLANSSWLNSNSVEIEKNDRLSRIEYFAIDYRNFLIKKDFIQKKNILMRAASVLSGMFFVAECLMQAKNISYWNKLSYIGRNSWVRDWISTKKCEEMLDALIELLKLSVELEDACGHAYLLDLLNADYYKKLILNNTKLWAGREEQYPMGANSQKKTVLALYKIMNLVDNELLASADFNVECGYQKLLPELLATQHKYMSDLSIRSMG